MSLKPQDPNDPLIAIWKRTHDMSRTEYSATIKPLNNGYTLPAHHVDETPENAASRERNKQFLKAHPHSFAGTESTFHSFKRNV